MSNFELIDDYLANRLNEQERMGFEQQLAGDPALKEEVQFQQRVIDGVRHARAVELKTMLKNVPLNGSTWSTGKFTAAAVTVGIVATSLYFYLKDDQIPAPVVDNPAQESVQESKEPQNAVNTPADSNESDAVGAAHSKEKTETGGKSKAARPVTKPNIQVTDPSVEFTETERVADRSTTSRGEITPSKMEVITGVADKKHNFHYQFTDNKLLLYGPFDKSLYEILEIHGDGHAVFLFYRENYYLLDEKQTAITSLEPIRDAQLLKKLKEYRGR